MEKRSRLIKDKASLMSDRKAELDSIIRVRPPFNVNRDVLENNESLDTVVQQVYNTFDARYAISEKRFEIPPYERQIKDKRFRDTSVSTNYCLDTERMRRDVNRCREV